MANGQLSEAVRRLCKLFAPPAGAALNDRQLLERFASLGDEAAFEKLVQRHGPLVHGVCRRILGNDADADDAFQACFVVLARKAGTVGWRDSVGNWLYGVACHIAQRARRQAARRRQHEQQARSMPRNDAERSLDWEELRPLLDEELQRLPAKYRQPVLLCCLHGQSRDEAAAQLGWTVGEVKGRLERGRELLRGRLAARGLTLSAALLGTLLAQGVVSAVPAPLVLSTMQAVTGGTLPAPVAVLVKGTVQAMYWAKIKLAALVVLLVAAVVTGAGTLLYPGNAGTPASLPGAAEPPALPVSTAKLAVPAPEQEPESPDWGTIKGQIVFAGDQLPDAVELKVDKDQQHCLENGKLFGQEWVVNKDNKGIRWVFVWLASEPGAAKKELPVHPALQEIKDKKITIDQPCCTFEPHALAVREGQIVVAKNSSPIAHNFNYAGHPLVNQGKNQLMPPKSEIEIDNLRADERFPVTVSCNIHGWMKAYVRVFNHPYFAVTNEKGEFEIKNAPAGDWRLKIWHDSGWRGGAAGRDGEKITIKGGAATDLGKLAMKP